MTLAAGIPYRSMNSSFSSRISRRSILATAVLPAFRLKAAEPTGLDLFLLIGQSNMAGRGVPEPADKQPIDQVWSLGKSDEWGPAVDPLHFDKPDIAGVGIGRSFAKTLLTAAPAKKIGLIPSAFGGTSLEQWTPGGELYSNAVRRTKIALRSGQLRGILWHQGEADSSKESLASSYRERWTSFIESLRKDLGQGETPVVLGELGHFLYTRPDNPSPFAKQVNEQLAMIPVSVARTVFVPSDGLVHKGDVVHFDTASLREFGRRYALGYRILDPTWTS